MQVEQTALPGVVLIQPRIFGDDRGHFCETWHTSRYAEAGIPGPFVQDNVSLSQKGVLRGLHFQRAPNAQGKLVSALRGRIFDVAVDIRPDSPTFRQWVGVYLDGVSRHQLYVPAGYAHGFVAMEDDTLVQYKCTALYSPQDEGSVIWNDPALGIEWPVAAPLLSGKDAVAPRLGGQAP